LKEKCNQQCKGIIIYELENNSKDAKVVLCKIKKKDCPTLGENNLL
jgi:hypothetical protein